MHERFPGKNSSVLQKLEKNSTGEKRGDEGRKLFGTLPPFADENGIMWRILMGIVSLTRYVKFCRWGSGSPWKRLYRGARAASDVREKASLKFHVTTKWKQFDTRPATALYIKFKKAALGLYW